MLLYLFKNVYSVETNSCEIQLAALGDNHKHSVDEVSSPSTFQKRRLFAYLTGRVLGRPAVQSNTTGSLEGLPVSLCALVLCAVCSSAEKLLGC
jgi:hypothetical protein